MIKRTYFMHAKLNHLDGNQSYSWHYSQATYKSWLPKPVAVFGDLFSDAKNEALKKGLSEKAVEVTCFSRC